MKATFLLKKSSPYEIFHGCAPDKTLFKPQMEQEKLLRKAESQALSCENCVFVE